MEMLLDKMILYFHYPFVRYALIVGVLIAFCSSLLGVTLVLKRFSFIGDGLSHVAFGAMAVAAVFQMTNEMPLVLCITVACAVLLLRTGQGSRIRGDAAIAMVSVGALAVGYLLMNVFSSSANVSGVTSSRRLRFRPRRSPETLFLDESFRRYPPPAYHALRRNVSLQAW